MKYSKALIVSIEEAQQLASHFESEYLESWHLLIAFSNYPYSCLLYTSSESKWW